jgi:hypothetical protein
MLNSPTADQGGFCNLFTLVELKQLAHREPKLMDKIKEANKSITMVDSFLRAYGKLSASDLQKLVSVLEVKCIMHAFNKKSETRVSYDSFAAVMRSVMEDAKKLDSNLPALPALEESIASSSKRPLNSSLRQHGTVPDAVLEARGFKVGAVIYEKQGEGKQHYTIITLNADETTITVKPVNVALDQGSKTAKAKTAAAKAKSAAKAGLADEVLLKRAELQAWVVKPDDKPIYYTDILPAADNLNLQRSIIEGSVKQLLLKEMQANSAEDKAVVVLRDGTFHVHVTKAFNEGKFSLIPVTSAVSVVEKKLADPWIQIGSFGKHAIYLKSSNTSLKADKRDAAKKASTELVAKFWVAHATNDGRIANCEVISWTAEISIGKNKVEVEFPKIINSVALKNEDEVLVLSESSKRAKTD